MTEAGGAPVALTLPLAVAELLLAHARSEAPNEACGLLSGSWATGLATAFHATRNADASPLRYTVHEDDLLRIIFAIEDAGEDLVAIFHSHTHSPAVPSPTDRRAAMYPDAIYLIASLADAAPDRADTPDPAVALRAWRIRGGEAAEVPVRLA